MNVEQVEIDRLVPWDRNPRAITEEAFAGLCESIKKFGMPQPIVANSRNNHIAGGHQRHRAAKHLGWTHVPVVWVDLSEADEAALNLTLNNPHIMGTFTPEVSAILELVKGSYDQATYDGLKLVDMQLEGTWESDISTVGELNEASVGIIRVKHPHALKDTVLEAIKSATGIFAGVTVEA